MSARSSRIAGPRLVARLGPLDQRTAAWRDDLADIALAPLVAVPSYAAPVMLQVSRQTPMLSADQPEAVATSELLPGELFAMLDSGHGYAWGYAVHDGYVGHVAQDALRVHTVQDQRMIGPGDALVFAAPDIKSPVISTLPAGARITATPADDRFAEVPGGFVHLRHLLPETGDGALDWVDVARGFAGAPYRWGGRSRAGIDCSGLVQMARMLSGHRCRRDSDMQAADATLSESPARGDLACWPGHIGILTAPDRILHANAHWMRCLEEPLADVIARAGSAPSVRRF